MSALIDILCCIVIPSALILWIGHLHRVECDLMRSILDDQNRRLHP